METVTEEFFCFPILYLVVLVLHVLRSHTFIHPHTFCCCFVFTSEKNMVVQFMGKDLLLTTLNVALTLYNGFKRQIVLSLFP